jgi:hypothetical protein
MLSDTERAALRTWYGRPEIMDEVRRLYGLGRLEEIEELLHRICLMPLSKHDELPDYMRDEEGKPLFPKNLNPMQDEEKWQDAIEVAWEVVEERLDFSHDDVHRAIGKEQQADWEAWLKDVERRKRERS